MNTLETHQELDRKFQEYQREQQRKPKPNYHPIGLDTDEKLLEHQQGLYKMLLETEPTFYTTFVFQRKFSNKNIEQLLTYGEQKLDKFYKYIHRKIFGKYWYRPDFVHPQEHIKMYLFPEKIDTHPHYCGVVEVKNTKMFPRKVEMFLEHSNRIWNTNKKLLSGDMDVLVPNGHIRIEPPRSVENVCRYSVKEQYKEQYYGHYFIRGHK
jgi:hypothetical protein